MMNQPGSFGQPQQEAYNYEFKESENAVIGSTANWCIALAVIEFLNAASSLLGSQHLFGRSETMGTPAGMTLTIDEGYMKESIQKPQAKIVLGFTSVQMPQFGLSDLQVDALIAYLKTL